MKKFKEFLLEERIFGIDPFGNRSQAELMKLASSIGYKVEHGPKHIKIINPATGQLVASLSHGSNRNEYNERYALKNIARDLEKSGSALKPKMDEREIGRRLRTSTKPQGTEGFPRAAIGLSTTGALIGAGANQAVEAGLNMTGMLTPPPSKERMEVEKSLNTDVGVGFDLSPEGELIASPEGFKAVKQRQQKGINFSTAFPSDLYQQ